MTLPPRSVLMERLQQATQPAQSQAERRKALPRRAGPGAHVDGSRWLTRLPEERCPSHHSLGLGRLAVR